MMIRSIALGFASVIATVLSAEAQELKAEPKPPWQRLLQGEDSKKAAELVKRIEECEAGDKYAEAIVAAEELLRLRQQIQGVDHWQVVSARIQLQTMRAAAQLPAERRIEWRRVVPLNKEILDLREKGRPLLAQPLAEEVLAIQRRCFGEEHAYTAASYNTLADNLNSQGKYAEAQPLFE